jgi:Ca2+-binding EF-hand superfamily protein
MSLDVSTTNYNRTNITTQMAQKLFKKLDTDSNDGVDKAEFAAISGSSGTSDVSDIFSKIDTNGDGSIDESENDSALQKLSEKMEAAFSKMGSSQKMGPPPSAAEMFSSMDTDSSGAISEDEFSAVSDSDENGTQFSDIDTDGNGEISEAENSDFLEKMGPPQGPPPGGMGGMSGMSEQSEDEDSTESVASASSTNFSDLLSALKSTFKDDETDETDETDSSIKQLFNELKSNIKYSSEGSLSYSTSSAKSLFSIIA